MELDYTSFLPDHIKNGKPTRPQNYKQLYQVEKPMTQLRKKRRQPVNYITPTDAINKLNSVVDEANAHIAKIKKEADHIYSVASDEIERLTLENEQLKNQLTELNQLRKENEQLKKELTKLRNQRRKKLKQDEFNYE